MMMTHQKNNMDVERAWQKLYTRLDQEGLIASKPETDKTRKPHMIFRYAAIAAMVAGITVFSFLYFNPLSKEERLTLLNEEPEVSLVTTLEDGSIVYLGQQAFLSFPKYFDKNKREVLLKGNAFFEVQKQSGKPFFIETELIRVEVLGTSFDVKAYGSDSFSLSVETGEVKVLLKKDGQTVYARANEKVILDSSRRLKLVVSEKKEISHLHTYPLHFKDGRLIDIVEVINKRSDGTRLQLAADLQDLSLTLTFHDESPELIAGVICRAFNLSYKKKGNIISISKLN